MGTEIDNTYKRHYIDALRYQFSFVFSMEDTIKRRVEEIADALEHLDVGTPEWNRLFLEGSHLALLLKVHQACSALSGYDD